MNDSETPGSESLARSEHQPQVRQMHNVESVLLAFDLPSDAAAYVREVVKRTRLNQTEKLQVAIELAARFRGGLDAGQSEASVLSEFGDRTQAAKKFRRDMLKARPLTWHIARRAGQLIGVLTVAYVLLAGYFTFGDPQIKTNYWRKINAPAEALAHSDRAWPVYRELTQQLGIDDEIKPEHPASYLFQPNNDERSVEPELRQWLHDHANELAQLRAAAGKPGLGFIYRSIMAENERDDPYTPNRPLLLLETGANKTLRNLARLLSADGRLAREEGDTDRLVANLWALDGIAQHCNEPPLLLSTLYCLSIRVYFINLLEESLVNRPELLSNEELDRIARRLRRWDIPTEIKSAVENERDQLADVLQRVYTDDGQGNGHISLIGFRRLLEYGDYVNGTQSRAEPRQPLSDAQQAIKSVMFAFFLPVVNYVVDDRKSMMERYDQRLRNFDADQSVPRWKRLATAKPPEGKKSTLQLMRDAPVALFVLAIQSLPNTSEQAVIVRDSALLGIELTLHRREHGAWPASLDELSLRYLPSMPVDPINGEPLRYRVKETGPVVYSVGSNRKDDGGVWVPVHNNAYEWQLEPAQREQPRYQGDWILYPSLED